MVDGDDHNMPEAGKYNGGQKLLFWLLVACMALLLVSGIVIWRAYFSAPVPDRPDPLVFGRACSRGGADDRTDHRACLCRDLDQGHDTRDVYGTVSRAWAKQHHPAWFRQMTGGGK